MSTTIKSVKGYEVLDSRGNPTVLAKVELHDGSIGCACAPSGASTGSKEALELRDQDERYFGKGVLQAVSNINQIIAMALRNVDATNQGAIDELLIELDGTPNKSQLGANALLAVSLAAAHAAANSKKLPLFASLSSSDNFILPVPMMNIINGGMHADNRLDIQEFMILPVGARNFSEAIRFGAEVFHTLKGILKKRGLNTAVGDEGGFAPDLPANHAALDIILQAIQEAGYEAGRDIYLGLDIASSELYQDGQYVLASENKSLSPVEFVDYLADLQRQYPILTIEDGMAENDWAGWQLLTEKLGNKLQLVGDDIFVTNTHLLAEGINRHVANAILIKPNQIGTLTETLAAVKMAKEAHYNTVMSHRSGETGDTTIADLAVATNAMQIKTGSLCRSDRVEKYNRLILIETDLMSRAHYAGKQPFLRWL